jgi:hypothetical protein
MRKPNYSQVKKQKEFSRKARQQEKQQRKAERAGPEVTGQDVVQGGADPAAVSEPPKSTGDTSVGSGS